MYASLLSACVYRVHAACQEVCAVIMLLSPSLTWSRDNTACCAHGMLRKLWMYHSQNA